MLSIYHGNDLTAARQTAKKAWPTQAASDAAVVTISADNFLPGQLAEAVGGTSLFATECWYVLDTPSQQADFAAEFAQYLPDIAVSPHQFIVIETKLTAAQKKQYAAHTDVITDCSVTAPKRATAFGLVDHLCRKDKRKLWIELQTILRQGLSPEEIIGTLWWQLKTIRIAAGTGSAAEAGIKDYPYQKATAALRVFTLAEVEALSHELLAVYHDGHSGNRDITCALEEWVLRV